MERIVFLDANDAYDHALHGERLLSWLDGDASRHLIVLAYDDRKITYRGKQVVGPTGGTFRATGRMIEGLGQTMAWTRGEAGPVEFISGLSGQVQFLVHRNPENKILHTALVGEMNGLLHGLLLGTPAMATWTGWHGPPIYAEWIQAAPAHEPVAPRVQRIQSVPTLAIAPRAADALTGRQFREQIESLTLADRERAILRPIASGECPRLPAATEGHSSHVNGR